MKYLLSEEEKKMLSKEWINRIKKMYFYYNDNYIDKYWYEFITPIS